MSSAPNRDAYPESLAEAEARLVAERRRAAAAAGPAAPQSVSELLAEAAQAQGTIGVGLSGGGIRSATFCLGAFQALARAGLVRRIDYLSTVSGGGYFGSFLGRLFSREWIASPADVEAVLDGGSGFRGVPEGSPVRRLGPRVFRFLRDNGRYLAPRGSGDLLMMLAVALRNWIAIHVVLVTLALTLFVALQGVRLGAGLPAAIAGGGIEWSWVFALLLPLAILFAVPTAWAYWLIPAPGTRGGLVHRSDWLVFAVCAGALLSGSLRPPARFAVVLVAACAIATAAWVRMLPRLAGDTTHVDAGSRARNRVSNLFKLAMIAGAAIAALGAVDTLGGTLHARASGRGLVSTLGWLATSFAGAAAFGRQVVMLLSSRAGDARPALKWSVVMWIAAVVVGAAWLVTVNTASHAIARGFGSAGAVAALGVLAVFTLVFGYSPTFLNMSTLHQFYAQRLTRAYLGASNRERLEGTDTQVTDVVDGDDAPMASYWKDAIGKGAPLHIVNVTINETLDFRTGVQQQDRKGLPLAVGPAGASVGVVHHLVGGTRTEPQDPERHRVFDRLAAPPEALTLGRWVSISGAAFTAAAGARTSVPGAILATLANVRLGYWWDSGVERARAGWLPPVYRGLLSECIARLRGTADRLWNVSDGGHFENLGGYELVRRRLPLIVLIDAEADPDYTFDGLANLVRKARLDFGAEIRFLGDAELDDPARSPLPQPMRRHFGALDRLRRGRWTDEPIEDPSGAPPRRLSLALDRTSYSRAHAGLARVTWDDAHVSWLVYVKASLTGDEPADVVEYHRKHSDFPQETTADQFFDEAQWESYRRLGEHVAAQVLTPDVFALGSRAAART
mgnify:CR=1 FL=1